MSYIEFKPVLKKVNLKPDGKQEIVLEVTNGTLNGKLDALSEMIDCKVEVSLESLEVNYSITINARTNKPMREYTVDDKGVVQELKPSHEQLEWNWTLKKQRYQQKKKNKKRIVKSLMLLLSAVWPQATMTCLTTLRTS